MNNLKDLMTLLMEYKENNVQISPKSIVNTLKQLDVRFSPYGLKYDSETNSRMDIIVFYDRGTRTEIALLNDYIVAIEMDTRLVDMTETFMNCDVNFLDYDPNFWNIK